MLARQNLLRDRTRTLLGVCGVGVAIMMILVLLSVYVGTASQFSAWADHLDADLVVSSGGTDNAVAGESRILARSVEQLQRLPGVSSARPIETHSGTLDLANGHYRVLYVGTESPDGAGGPWRLRSGNRVPGEESVVLDGLLADQAGVRLGDVLEIGGNRLRVTGLSEGTHSGLFYVFLSRSTAAKMFGHEDSVSFVLVKATSAPRVAELARRISGEVPDTHVLTREEFAARTAAVLEEGSLPPLRLMVALGFLVGAAIIDLTLYTSILERVQEYAVVKALGGSEAQLVRIVLIQGLWVTLVGCLFGAFATLVAAQMLNRFAPLVSVTFEPAAILFTLLLALLLGAIGSILPASRITRTDPAVAFRA